MNAWMNTLLPEMPKLVDEDSISLKFSSSFVGTVFLADYRGGHAEFRSDSISTLMIVKDVLSKEANFRNIAMDFKWTVNNDSIQMVLSLLDEKIQNC